MAAIGCCNAQIFCRAPSSQTLQLAHQATILRTTSSDDDDDDLGRADEQLDLRPRDPRQTLPAEIASQKTQAHAADAQLPHYPDTMPSYILPPVAAQPAHSVPQPMPGLMSPPHLRSNRVAPYKQATCHLPHPCAPSDPSRPYLWAVKRLPCLVLHDQLATCCHGHIIILTFLRNYPIRHLQVSAHQVCIMCHIHAFLSVEQESICRPALHCRSLIMGNHLLGSILEQFTPACGPKAPLATLQEACTGVAQTYTLACTGQQFMTRLHMWP